MRKKKLAASDERQIITAMIVDPVVLGHISVKWDGRMFRSDWANHVARMCVDYHQRYEKAPEANIANLFRRWAANRPEDDKTVDIIDRFLTSLNDEYESSEYINVDHVVDLASHHFNQVRMERLRDEIDNQLDLNRVDAAEQAIAEHHRVELGMGSFVDVLNDEQAIENALTEVEEPLFIYKGRNDALRKFIGKSMARDSFVCFMGPEKRGKTFWLLDAAWRAMLDRNRVAFFSVGDMSQNQIMHRLMSRAVRAPIAGGKYRIPTSINRAEGEEIADVDFKECKSKSMVHLGRALKAFRKVQKSLYSRQSLLKLSCWPNDSIGVEGINDELAVLERDGWIPDVIVIDYADILLPPAGPKEFRHQQNKLWKQLRALSQQKHCLVLTATQSDSRSYSNALMTKSNFSEDKRKLAHVTGLIGLNQTVEEYEIGVTRLNWIVRRDAASSGWKVVNVAGCLPICNPSICSCP